MHGALLTTTVNPTFRWPRPCSAARQHPVMAAMHACTVAASDGGMSPGLLDSGISSGCQLLHNQHAAFSHARHVVTSGALPLLQPFLAPPYPWMCGYTGREECFMRVEKWGSRPAWLKPAEPLEMSAIRQWLYALRRALNPKQMQAYHVRVDVHRAVCRTTAHGLCACILMASVAVHNPTQLHEYEFTGQHNTRPGGCCP